MPSPGNLLRKGCFQRPQNILLSRSISLVAFWKLPSGGTHLVGLLPGWQARVPPLSATQSSAPCSSWEITAGLGRSGPGKRKRPRRSEAALGQTSPDYSLGLAHQDMWASSSHTRVLPGDREGSFLPTSVSFNKRELKVKLESHTRGPQT